ncbi:uncharacterized protein LOC107884827 [Acyrthosiphon pisum]|uniref:Uncharacterized protein n=1 Tax=Acyrthosiphon pisum TaxID=7029 RepID=A0A8R2H845_ACYPI|nr:uncharacterized protein LOC107884827 [Acyrthosiphon pisum]|eukprot:XP_016663227.1 PREDICTED: uncharacterized protein LOC107884827 [Acyrthosiphon pisum]
MDRYIIANIISILLIIISSVAAESIISEEETRKILRFQRSICPPVGQMNEFELTTLQTTTKMFGCVYLGLDKPSSPVPLFHLWVEDPQLVVDKNIDMRGSCRRTHQMDHFMFKCLSRFIPTDEVEYKNNWSYTSLQEYTAADQYENVTTRKVYRCAMYHMVNDLEMEIRSIRMVISKPVTGEQFDIRQCDGLSALLGREDLPMLPKGMRYWPDGSMLLFLLGKEPDSRNFNQYMDY